MAVQLTPREFRTRLISLARDLRQELAHPEPESSQYVMRQCLALLDDLEGPLERFVMTSPDGMRKR